MRCSKPTQRGARAGCKALRASSSALASQGAPQRPGVRGSNCVALQRSHNGRLELELAVEGAPLLAPAPEAGPADASSQPQFDCLGLAQAMVDFSAAVDDSLLGELQVEKGSRRLIGIEERADVLSLLEGREYSIAAGGSLSNTLMALARLSEASERLLGEAPLRVGMTGLVGGDPLGEFYCSQMRQAGVEVCSAPLAGASTGTVVVLTSQNDAQRTMLSHLGTAAEVAVDAALEAAIARSRVLVVEGYLWELPNAERTIASAIAAAQRHGCLVAMTAGDAGVVERHHAEMWRAIDRGIDLLFTNAGEAAALLRYEPSQEPGRRQQGAGEQQGAAAPAAAASQQQLQHCAAGEQLALGLGPHCSVVVVTDGDRGSYMTALGQLHCVPPCWLAESPVDTCGAGDAYAAGLLYGYLRHYDLVSMGRTAARTASAVISRHGAALSPEAAEALMEALPRPASARPGKAAQAAGQAGAQQGVAWQPPSPTSAALQPSTPRMAAQ